MGFLPVILMGDNSCITVYLYSYFYRFLGSANPNPIVTVYVDQFLILPTLPCLLMN